MVGGHRPSCRLDLAQDVLALGAPEVAFGGFVVFSEKADDRVGQFADRGEALLGDEVGKIAKEAFDQVEPGRGGGSEVHVEAGMLGQPPLHLGVLVGGRNCRRSDGCRDRAGSRRR